MSLEDIVNQAKILKSENSNKNEQLNALRILQDYANVQNIPDAWMELALYYLGTEKPRGIFFLGRKYKRIQKALECLRAISSESEYAEEANLLILTILSGSYDCGKDISKADELARKLLSPPFYYSYEDQKTIFSIMIGFVNEAAINGEAIPTSDDTKTIEAFVAEWEQYRKQRTRNGMSPEAELELMKKSYAYAHYIFLERYIEQKLIEGNQGAYWAYGFVFFTSCNHLMHPVSNKSSQEYIKLEEIFSAGIKKGDLGVFRSIIELYYEEHFTNFFDKNTVQFAIDKLKEMYPDEYQSMVEDFKENNIVFP